MARLAFHDCRRQQYDHARHDAGSDQGNAGLSSARHASGPSRYRRGAPDRAIARSISRPTSGGGHNVAVRSDAVASPSRQPALDWLNFFVANVQTGFGPFIAVYLTSEAWTQRDIGQVLSIGTFAAMLSQLPGGALVDALHNKRLAALAAALAIGASALIFAIAPRPLPVVVAEVLHGFASCMLMPAIAAISLQLVGRAGLGERLGRNARFSAIGSGV